MVTGDLKRTVCPDKLRSSLWTILYNTTQYPVFSLCY